MYTRDPWEQMEAIERHMMSMMSAFARDMKSGTCHAEACNQEKIINDKPPYDICTGDASVHVIAEMQGLSCDAIDVVADNTSVTITSDRREMEMNNADTPLQMTVPLPVPIIPGTVQWDVVHGILEVSAARDLSTAVREEGYEDE